ncbi:MAG: PDZ domain-containing protein [Lewinellaceae bacterium]|nr:PDZ domain-containing protein [Saprospiraceae bacterium]MCB9340122.1 PDZ domain-containing protein [Lewinellaceae bacterium]
MKYLFSLMLAFLISSPGHFAQTRENNWDEFGERLAERAERIAERAARQAERTAAKWEVAADRYAEAAERQWNRKWRPTLEQFPHRVRAVSCPDVVFLGIESSGLTDEKARKLGFSNLFGSYVTKIIDGSAAQEAGLQPFDYIYGVNEQRTSDNQGLSDIIEDYKPGEEVTLHLYRQGKPITLSVKLRSYEEQDWQWNEDDQRAFLGVSPNDDEDPNDMNGASVDVVENSTAAEMGLQDGDVIKGINGYPILDWEDVEIAVSNMKPGEEVEVVYARNGEEANAHQTIKSYEEVYPESSTDWEWKAEEGDFDWDQQEETEEGRAFLGVYIERISEEKANKLGFDNPYGSYITGILKNTGAEKAGLKPFDYIFGIDEYRVGEKQSLGGILTKYQPGDQATIHFIRKGKKNTTQLTFGNHADAVKVSRNSCEDPFLGINQFYEDGQDDLNGVKISPVKNSTAMEIGLQKGDIILSINGYTMVDWTDITTAINMLSPGETIAIEFLRDGKNMKASQPIKSYAESKNCDDCDCGKKENISINMGNAFDWTKSFDNPMWNNRNGDEGSPRMEVANAKVALENVSSAEESNLKSKGIEIPSSGNLAVERLSLSPNPTMGMFELKFNLASEGKTVVRVFNTAGRAIYEYDLGKFSGDFNDYVDISQNGPGNYFLQINQGGKVYSRKIVLSGN